MMESTPVAAFKVSQPQLLFRLLIIPFNDPAVLGHFYQSLSGAFAGIVDVQCFAGSALLRGHSILQWRVPVSVLPRGARQAFYICREAFLLWAWRRKA